MSIPRAFLVTLVISLIAAPAFAQESQAAHPGYAGADACKSCHGAIFDAWQGTKHARAIDKLTPSERQGDACIRCHVTGSPEQIAAEGGKPSLPNVQCEACHGAAAAHAADPSNEDRSRQDAGRELVHELPQRQESALPRIRVWGDVGIRSSAQELN